MSVIVPSKMTEAVDRIWRTMMRKDEVCLTWVRAARDFGRMTQRELLAQIRLWRERDVECLPENIYEIAVNGSPAWLFVVAPRHRDSGTCPLAMSYGVIVTGYSYIVKERSTAELVSRALGS